MVTGVMIAIVGTTLLSRIGLETSTVQWAAFSVITGVGIGLGIQLPYTAIQVALRYVNVGTLLYQTKRLINQ